MSYQCFASIFILLIVPSIASCNELFSDTKLDEIVSKLDLFNAKLVKIEDSNARITNFVETTLKNFREDTINDMKALLENHIKSTVDDNNAMLQDLTYLKLRLNEFKISGLENSLSAIKEGHTKQASSLNELKSLINDNRENAMNENLALQQKLTKQTSELENVGQLVKRLKVLSTNEISNCADIVDQDSGVYQLYTPKHHRKPVDVYCLKDTNNGATWTIIQRRVDNTTEFYRGWDEYKNGFGDVETNYWIGLEYLHALTNETPHELWIYLEDFEGNKKYAMYSNFSVDDEKNKYKINLGDFKGDAGDSLKLVHNKQKFSTFDNDNDTGDFNCAELYRGGWWFKACHDSHLNGVYYDRSPPSKGRGIIWDSWLGSRYSLKISRMAIRPVN